MNTQLDIDFVRSQFPGLHNGWTLFDNAGGSQILRPVVEKLSDFYLSALQLSNQDLTRLSDEIALVETYAFLIEQRYGEHFRLRINVSGQEGYMPSLTLQMLLENVLKHNVISTKNDMEVELIEEGGKLIFRNTLSERTRGTVGAGFGLSSIRKRYQLLLNAEIEVKKSDTYFWVILPIIRQA